MKKFIFALLGTCLSFYSFSHSFDLITLGSKGGIQDGNLTAFLIKDAKEQHYISLDAGSIVNGLIAADAKGSFNHVTMPDHSELSKVGFVFKERIKGYFISHAHLDHVAGLIISSPDDTKKPIYGLKETNEAISANYFNWSAWPNFGNKGQGFKLNKYNYIDLVPYQWIKVNETKLQIMPMPLTHSGGLSTGFLIKNDQNEAFAYFGDTGPDSVEKSDNLKKAWEQLAPFIKDKRLKGIVIETSYTNERPDNKLFGHLTPKWLLKELSVLEKLTAEKSLEGLPVVISHIKYSLNKKDPMSTIQEQLVKDNKLGVQFIFPEQGELLTF